MARIVSRPNMHRAWKRVKSNQGAPGCDGMTLEEFPDFVRQHWAPVRQALLDGSYRPGRSAHGALRQVQRFITDGYRVAVDLDLARFFDEVQHDVLMVRVARKVSDKVLLRLIGRYLRGWMNYFGISQYYRPIPELDHWLRRRVRMCYWKQWRKPRTRIGHLIKLGTSSKHAISG